MYAIRSYYEDDGFLYEDDTRSFPHDTELPVLQNCPLLLVPFFQVFRRPVMRLHRLRTQKADLPRRLLLHCTHKDSLVHKEQAENADQIQGPSLLYDS